MSALVCVVCEAVNLWSMAEGEDPRKLADELDRQAGELADKSTELEQEIGEVHDDWERKRADPTVPGAPPRRDDPDGEAPDGDAPDGDAPDGDAPDGETSPEDGERGEHEAPQDEARDEESSR